MSDEPSSADLPLSVAEGFRRIGLTLDEAWVEYLVMGGRAGRAEVEAALIGLDTLEPVERNKLAAGLNENFVDAGQNHPVDYVDEDGGAADG